MSLAHVKSSLIQPIYNPRPKILQRLYFQILNSKSKAPNFPPPPSLNFFSSMAAATPTPPKTPVDKSSGFHSNHQADDSSSSRSRFEAYNRLQAMAVAFGEKLPIPEIVAVGGQSDGKSSLLEALLGFRFNVREVEMGTRRPLILQMVHDLSALEPRCSFQVLFAFGLISLF